MSAGQMTQLKEILGAHAESIGAEWFRREMARHDVRKRFLAIVGVAEEMLSEADACNQNAEMIPLTARDLRVWAKRLLDASDPNRLREFE